MEFNLPKTKEEMYTILNDLFHFYRINIGQFADIGLKSLAIPRVEFYEKTEAELKALAKELLKPEHIREINAREENIQSEIVRINNKIQLINDSRTTEKANVEKNYLESTQKIEEQIKKSGLINSSVLVDKLTQMEENKNKRLLEIDIKTDEEIAELDSRRNSLNLLTGNSEKYYSEIHQAEINAKAKELKEDQEKEKRNVRKTNSAMDEKEQRYANQIKETNESFHLKFMDIRARELTKDELVEMGYYNDVLRCVSGYLDTLTPQLAYTTVCEEKKLMLYLDDYYQNVVYLYMSRKG